MDKEIVYVEKKLNDIDIKIVDLRMEKEYLLKILKRLE